MKKYIDNKLYNTDTAKLIGTYWSGDPSDTLFSYTESLYRKKQGAFFLHGDGGPGSPYPEDGGKIIPMDYETASKWAQKFLTAEEFEAAFEIPTEDESTEKMALSLTVEAAALLRKKASISGYTMGEIVSGLIVDNFE